MTITLEYTPVAMMMTDTTEVSWNANRFIVSLLFNLFNNRLVKKVNESRMI